MPLYEISILDCPSLEQTVQALSQTEAARRRLNRSHGLGSVRSTFGPP